MIRITEKDFDLFLQDIKEDTLYKKLRLGQAFINYFNIKGSYPDIYYENDKNNAIEKIRKTFLTLEKE